ncbi:MAG: molybdenum ABC transporter ATP-binding protein [Gammaproteobacteria bacterium]|nr:molybdenum ABC transporter ATP-binding protein [Gammaproteobacteria bacterium]MCP5201859.1 molybdenum ABC transporter ATP-binding protein [Gammaproteobacteria bacterium]
MSVLAVDLEIQRDAFTLRVAHDFALDGISAVFGASGAGKSTLLRALAGLERDLRGRVAFDTEVWQDSARGVHRAAHRRGVGYVFQDARLLPFLDVAGNLRYAARRAPAARPGPQFEQVVTAFDLAPLLGRDVTRLSGGERQRVAIARALLTRPRLLLMDEPLSANDIRRKAELLPYVRGLPARFGVPVLYVSHALDEVAYLADHVLVLEAGRSVAAGPASDVLERLDLGSAADWYEAGTVLSGRVVEQDERFQLTRVAVGAHRVAVPRVAAARGDNLRLRVRARDVALAVESPRGISIRNVLAGTVIDIVEDPASAYAEALVDIGEGHLRSRLTRAAVAELGLAPGATVYALVRSVTVDAPFAEPAAAPS